MRFLSLGINFLIFRLKTMEIVCFERQMVVIYVSSIIF